MFHPLDAPPVLQLEVTHDHGMNANWIFLSLLRAAGRVVRRLCILLVQVFHGVEHQVGVRLLMRATVEGH